MNTFTRRIRQTAFSTATACAILLAPAGMVTLEAHAQMQPAMSLDDIVAKVRTYEFGDSREPLSVINELVTAALHDGL